MNVELQHRITLIRTALENDSDGITVGDLPPGTLSVPPQLLDLPSYCAFVRETNGARFGGVDFWTVEDLERNQYLVDELPSGRNRWICIGQVLYQPLLLSRQTEQVHLMDLENPDGLGRSFGSLDDFLSLLVGSGYEGVLDVRDDVWADMLARLQLSKLEDGNDRK